METFDEGHIVQGRFWVYLPTHTRITKKGYIKRSIIAYEAYHQCTVCPWAHLHHKDENTLNDSKENLQLMTRGGHLSYHKLGENHPNYGKMGEASFTWKGEAASDHAKYMREWNTRK